MELMDSAFTGADGAEHDSASLVRTALKGTQNIASRRAQILLRHYPAASPLGREMASRLERNTEDREAEQFLRTLPPEAFTSYAQRIQDRSGWDEETVRYVLDHTAIVEATNGCPYDCAMCYIDAPKLSGSIPWPNMQEIIHHLAARHRQVLAHDAVDALVSDVLIRNKPEPSTALDVVLSLARHRRNRFPNFSDHLMQYWRSNPTGWRDPLFQRHFGHIAEEVLQSFQLADTDMLLNRIQSDADMRDRFQRECAGDPRKLRDATTLHAPVSTVPYARGSINDQAVQYVLQRGIASGKHLRVSAPHCNLMPSRSGTPDRYWQDLSYTLQSANPKVVYLYCTNLREFEELVLHISQAFERSDRPWWIESRLALYELGKKRSAGASEEEIFTHLQKQLKRLLFIGNAEGRAKSIQSPFFEQKGTVMCVNGVVLTADGVAFQSCTTPDGSDREEGEIIHNIHTLSAEAVRALIASYPLVNRARESATPNIAALPLEKRRPPIDWFEREKEDLRAHSSYDAMKDRMQRCYEQARGVLRLS